MSVQLQLRHRAANRAANRASVSRLASPGEAEQRTMAAVQIQVSEHTAAATVQTERRHVEPVTWPDNSRKRELTRRS